MMQVTKKAKCSSLARISVPKREFGFIPSRWGVQGEPQILNYIPRAVAKWWFVLGNSLHSHRKDLDWWLWVSGCHEMDKSLMNVVRGSGKCHIPIISNNGPPLHPNGKRWTYFSSISPKSLSLSAPSLPPAKFSVEIRQTKIERSGLQIIFFQFCSLIPVTNRLYLGKRNKVNSCWTILVSISHLKNITSMEKEQK